jgi:hypothetical protein
VLRERGLDGVLPSADFLFVAGGEVIELGGAVRAERGKVVGDVDLRCTAV